MVAARESVARVTGPVVHWIVDYDIPVNDPNRRRAFYRELARLKQSLDLHGQMSTASVVFTADRELAHEIYKICCKYAKVVNLYRAILVETRQNGRRCDK